jgi:diadenosine tetraphosphatase ApaH/serine/threonine PP2A family protein phosphatase
VTWTKEHLSASAHTYLAGLSPMSRVSGCALFHGSPRGPVWSYVLKPSEIADSFALSAEPLLLVGHTHVAMAASLKSGRLLLEPAGDGAIVDLTRGRWLLNPGSVGQPREGDPRAAYLLLDLDAGRAEFKRVDYDIERTQIEMRELGLPEQLAVRLSSGL